LRELELADKLVRGELRPGGTEREWCDPDVLRRLRRASLAALRKEVEPAEQAALGRFLPGWHGIDRRASLREALVPLQGLALPVGLWESEVLRRRVPNYRPEHLDALCATGEVVWVGAGADRVALYFREDAPALGQVPAAPGRGWATERRFAGAPDRRALAELLRERQGIVTRDGVRAEGIPGGYGAVYAELRALETLGLCRRGYFVEGLGGAQFALGGGVERLRELREAPEEADALVLAAADPAQPYGAALPWPRRAGARAARVAGAYVVLLSGAAVLYVERGGRTLVPLRDPGESWLR